MLFALLAACGPEPVVFTLSPETLDYGVVDFPPEMPGDAYATQQLSVTNTGETDGVLELPEPDPDIFCIAGFTTQDFPAPVGTVGPGSTYVFNVGLCGYPPGDAGSEVTETFDIWTDGDPDTITVTVKFTPNRITE